MSTIPASRNTVESAEYRYIMVNTLNDEVISELPFQNVSYSNSLNEAGSFSGNLPINSTTNTYDVYNSTVPGLTSMYVMRN